MKLDFRNKIYTGVILLLLIQGMVIFFWISLAVNGTIPEKTNTLMFFSVATLISAIIVSAIIGIRMLKTPDSKDDQGLLNEQKNRLQIILDAIPDFISLQDDSGRYIAVNKAFCEMINKKIEAVIGQKNNELFPKKLADHYTKEDNRVIETRTPLVKENKINGQKGQKWLHVVKIPVFQDNTPFSVRGLVCSGRNITELKSAQKQLMHAQKMESVGRLSAGVAHEINTPLGIILGYAQLLMEDVEKDGLIYQDLATIVKQTKICSKIAADLLKFSRPSESDVTVFNINDAIEEVLDVVEHTFGMNHVIVKREYEKNPLSVNGDKEKLKQVFVNLLNNAFDAIGENGSICINTQLGETPDQIKISISDTGQGIAKENIPKLFEPFYTTKGPDKGTGLGLSVTFGIIKEHNGTITAFSPPLSADGSEKGTQFLVQLPTGLTTKKGDSNGHHSRTG